MGTQLIKCGITQQAINGEPVQILLLTAPQEVKHVWDNKNGQATLVPFTSNKTLNGFFQIVSLPILGTFDDYLNFNLQKTQENVLPCFMIFRNIYGTDGYQSSDFNFQKLLNEFPNVSKTFEMGLFEVADLDDFNHMDELSDMMKKLCHDIMFNNVSSYNPATTVISQIHVSTIMDCVYQELATQTLPHCNHIHPNDATVKYYSENFTLNVIFGEMNDYFKQSQNQVTRNYLNQCCNAFKSISICKIYLNPVVSAGQDYDNISGSIMHKLTKIALTVALDSQY